MYKVRLIDVDYANATGENPEAHCIFEFVNLIADANGTVTIQWSEDNNYNFLFLHFIFF